MTQVTIYTKPYCPYCIRAVDLLERKGVAFTEIEAAFDPEKRQEMMRRAGAQGRRGRARACRSGRTS
jgi:glutaredoxin 3